MKARLWTGHWPLEKCLASGLLMPCYCIVPIDLSVMQARHLYLAKSAPWPEQAVPQYEDGGRNNHASGIQDAPFTACWKAAAVCVVGSFVSGDDQKISGSAR